MIQVNYQEQLKTTKNHMDSTGKLRSNKQSRALHKYFNDVALVLMEHGVDVRMLLAKFKEDDVPPSGDNVKAIFKSILFRTHGKNSTTEMTTTELNDLLMYFNKNIAELTGEDVVFPSEEVRQLVSFYSKNLV